MSSLFDQKLPEKFSTDESFEEFLEKECEFLAAGTSREVYLVRGNKYVLKVAKNEISRICNWTEVAAFFGFAGDQDKLGRVVSWSISGKFLVMERLDMTSRPSEQFEFPHWASDRKPSNVGKSEDGAYKMCDFAIVIPPNSNPPSPFA